jgi:hypothetical protein
MKITIACATFGIPRALRKIDFNSRGRSMPRLLSYCLPNPSLAVSFRDFILSLSRDSVGPAKAARRVIQSWIVRSGIFATFSAMRVAITSKRSVSGDTA